jgi:uncharacterized protein
MATLTNISRQNVLADQLIIADTFWSRAKGLLGKKDLPPKTAMWIKRCNSIHTFFMKFPIDVVFVNSQLRVIKVCLNVSPWKILRPAWQACSVLEFSAGSLPQVEKGDQLHVA